MKKLIFEDFIDRSVGDPLRQKIFELITHIHPHHLQIVILADRCWFVNVHFLPTFIKLMILTSLHQVSGGAEVPAVAIAMAFEFVARLLAYLLWHTCSLDCLLHFVHDGHRNAQVEPFTLYNKNSKKKTTRGGLIL